MKKRLVIGVLLMYSFIFSVCAIDFAGVNIAWQYSSSFHTKMSHRVFKDAKGVHVFLSVKSDSLTKWTYDFLLQRGYESESHELFVPLGIDTLVKNQQEVLLMLDISETNESLLVVKFSEGERAWYYDISLRIGALSFPSIYPLDAEGIPILDAFINRSGFSWAGNSSFVAMEHFENSPVAEPPMAEMKPMTPQAKMDSSFVFKDTTTFEENHFYMVRSDSIASVGVTMLRMPPYFPEYRQLGELIEAMFYLTSENERKSLYNSRNPKAAFDSFWLNTYSTKSRARNAIRAYYLKVKMANMLFTNFKAGYKTDRGMIFIVFGLPDEVYRTTNTEEWYYDSGAAFEFNIISSFFAPKTYTLRRSKGLEEQWYAQIAALRQNINE